MLNERLLEHQGAPIFYAYCHMGHDDELAHRLFIFMGELRHKHITVFDA